jgi:hypothetical protein
LAKSGVPLPEIANKMPLPAECAYLWTWFVELHNTGDFSPTQMQAYFQLRGITPKPFEIDALLDLYRLRNNAAS